MRLTAHAILLWAALICFALVAIDMVPRKGSLTGLGLAFFTGAFLV